MGVRYGIIGSGRMGTHHARQLQMIDDAMIVAVADVDVEVARVLGNEVKAHVYGDYHEMLEREELDAVYLCTPVQTRVEQVEAIVKKHVNLYIEKPLADSIEHGERIVELVEQSGILCTVGFQWRYMDFVHKAKEIISDEPIALFVGRYYWTVPLVPWIRNRSQGGGQMFDQNIHMVDLATYFNGPVREVYSAFTQKATIGEMENWDGYSTTMMFENATVGNFYSTYALHPQIHEDPFIDIIQKNRLLRITAGRLIVETPYKTENYMSQQFTGTINKEFHQAVIGKNQDRILAPVRDAFHTLKVVLAANYSALNAKVVQVRELNAFGLNNL